MWHDILGNKHMQKAIVMAQICLYAVPQPRALGKGLGPGKDRAFSLRKYVFAQRPQPVGNIMKSYEIHKQSWLQFPLQNQGVAPPNARGIRYIMNYNDM